MLHARRHDVVGTYFKNDVSGPRELDRLDICDEGEVGSAIGAAKPDILMHLAYDRKDFADTVVKGTRNILKAAQSLERRCRVIFLSSDAVFDGESPPYREQDIPRPVFPYGEAKRAAERDVLAQGGHVVRTSLVYGFNPPDSRTETLLKGLDTGRFDFPYFTDEIRCPLYVEDLCRSLLEIAELNEAPFLFHVAGPESLSRYAFAKKLALLWGYDDRLIPAGRLSESGQQRPRDVTLDTTLARTILKTRIRRVEDLPVAEMSVRKGQAF